MEYELTILMPSLNEEKTLQKTISDAQKFINKNNINAEILVIDNGSVDKTYDIAKKYATRVIIEKNKGYGNALKTGLNNVKGKFIIFGDSDNTYDFEHLDEFLYILNNGYDMVIGNRFLGGIEKGAMPFLHKYIGVPLLSYICRKKYKVNIGDFHCGLRGLKSSCLQNIKLKTTGMEFATEIIVEFKKAGYKIKEIPTVLRKGETGRKPHLRTFRDGLRHLKYILKN